MPAPRRPECGGLAGEGCQGPRLQARQQIRLALIDVAATRIFASGSAGFGPADHSEQRLEESLDKEIRVVGSDASVFLVDVELACMAAWLRRALEKHGTDEKIRVPLPRVVLCSVFKYCRWYRKKSSNVIPLPLRGDTCEACGASAWDQAFVRNMEKALFWKVFVAAEYLEIPGLSSLCFAACRLSTLGRSTEQVKWEYNMTTDDLTPEEEADIATMWADLRRQETSEFAGVAVFMHQFAASGKRVGIDVWESSVVPHVQEFIANTMRRTLKPKSFRQASWRALVSADWRKLIEAPADIRQDPFIVFAAMEASCGLAFRHATETLRSDRNCALWASELGGLAALEGALAPELAGDRDFMREAVAFDGAALACASDALRADRALVLLAVASAAVAEAAPAKLTRPPTGDADAAPGAAPGAAPPARLRSGAGAALRCAAQALRDDVPFVLQCVTIAPEAIAGASPALLNDRAFVLKAVHRSGMALRYLDKRFRADRQVVATALGKDVEECLFGLAARREKLRRAAPCDGQAAPPG